MGDSELTFASGLLPFKGPEETWGELEGWRFPYPEAEEDRAGESRHCQKQREKGTLLVVAWLRRSVCNAGGLGLIPGQGTRSHMPELKRSYILQ